MRGRISGRAAVVEDAKDDSPVPPPLAAREAAAGSGGRGGEASMSVPDCIRSGSVEILQDRRVIRALLDVNSASCQFEVKV